LQIDEEMFRRFMALMNACDLTERLKGTGYLSLAEIPHPISWVDARD